MKETSISLFKGYSDTHPQDSTLQEIVNLIRNDALVRDRTEKHRYYSHNGQKAAAAWEKAACPCFAVAVCFGGGKQAENITGWTSLALADIEARAEEILKDGKFPLLLGGEHLVTLGAVRAAVKKYPDLHIVHFDAHADLRDDYLGAKLSHACVLRRCHELVGDGHIHQFCIRSGDRAEFEFAAQHTEMHKFDFTGLAELTAQLCESKVPVYLTIDLDCLDPSCFPGTGTPEAGGVSFLQLLEAIRTVTKANIIGADLNELAPTLDTTGVSTATACKVLRETLIALDKGWPGFQV